MIYLNRNLFRSYVSRQIAMQTKQWIYSGKTKQQEEISLRIDPNHCEQYLWRARKREEFIRHILRNQASIEVEYDSLVESFNTELARIQNFLGISIRPLHTSLKKQNNSPLKNTIVNAEEAEEAAGWSTAEPSVKCLIERHSDFRCLSVEIPPLEGNGLLE